MMNTRMNRIIFLLAGALLAFTTGASAQNLEWTWVTGSNTTSLEPGNFHSFGTGSPENHPPSSNELSSATAPNGDLWLWEGRTSSLWKFDGTYWHWIYGDNAQDFELPVLSGNLGDFHPDNSPGDWITGAQIVVDSETNILLFGGNVTNNEGTAFNTNALWKFSSAEGSWALVSGTVSPEQFTNYGEKGVPSSENMPPPRLNHRMVIDGNNNIYVFGGVGSGNNAFLNDLWKWDGQNWTWISGSNTTASLGNLGTKGVSSPTNEPSARYRHSMWLDENDNIWVFGGSAYGFSEGSEIPTTGPTNQLLRWDGLNWTWITGSEFNDDPGSYGELGVADPSNSPYSRFSHTTVFSSDGNTYLFGGNRQVSSTYGDDITLGDLWQWDGEFWTLLDGGIASRYEHSFQEQGTPSSLNQMMTLEQHAMWAGLDEKLYFFGGEVSEFHDFVGLYGSIPNNILASVTLPVPPPPNWESSITAAQGAMQSSAFFGANAEATDGFDQDFDFPLPPLSPQGDFVQVYFDRSSAVEYPSFASNPLNTSFSSDILAAGPLEETIFEWDFNVFTTKTGEEVSMTIARPADFNIPMKVVMERDGTSWLEAGTGDLTFSYTPDPENPDERFTLIVGDVDPPLITADAVMDSPQIWDVNLSKTLTWTAEDVSGIAETILEYKFEDELSWVQIYQGTEATFDFIPYAHITDAENFELGEIRFRITSTDNVGNVAAEETFYPITLASPVQTFDLLEGWQLMGSPFFDGQGEGSILADAVRYSWAAQTSEYTLGETYGAADGVWVGAYQPGTEVLAGDISEQDIELILGAGWHLISVPLLREVARDSVLIVLGEGIEEPLSTDPGFYEDMLSVPYGYDPLLGDYFSADFFEPGLGYWLGVLDPNGVSLTFPIHDYVPEVTGKEVTEEQNRLLLSFVDGDRTRTLTLKLGEGRGSLAPPPAPGTSTIGFAGEETILGNAYLTQFVGEDDLEGFELPLRVDGRNRPITLNWELQGFEVADLELELADQPVHLTGSGSLELSASALNGAKVVVTQVASSVGEGELLPAVVALRQNYPNPFNPSTEIAYELPAASKVTLAVYNMLGQQVALLENSVKSAGIHNLRFDASRLGSGTYLYRLTADGVTITKKMLLVK